MSQATRRGFLAAAGVGAAAVGVASLAPAAFASTGAPVHEGNGTKEPLVAYLRDVRSGELSIMVGERETVVHDRDLAARISRAAGM